jgi:hypothetical protein
MRVCALESCDSEQGSVLGFREQDIDSMGSMNGGKFLNHLKNYQLLDKCSTTSNYLINRGRINSYVDMQTSK